ncbi:MAG: M28 family peptidase [Thermoanaerobaculia bacterium]
MPGSDAALAKTVFLVSGHFDSMPSSVMDPSSDAPGAADDASGVSVSLECARLLAGGTYRATLVFAAVSGEEQGLIGGKRLLEYLKEKGYTIGGFLNNDVVGADFAPGGPHRVRVFSAGGPDGVDSPSRDLVRAVEQIAGRDKVRMVFRLDRPGRGGCSAGSWVASSVPYLPRRLSSLSGSKWPIRGKIAAFRPPRGRGS